MEHSGHEHHDCCAAEEKAEAHSGHGKNSWNAAAHATLHCLTGCVIGELAGRWQSADADRQENISGRVDRVVAAGDDGVPGRRHDHP